MAKNKETKEVKKSADQVVEEGLVNQINAILEKAKYAIKAFLVFKEDGVFPGVKLVKVPEEEKASK